MIDTSQLEQLARQFERAAENTKQFAGDVLDEMGEKFLDIVQEEIMRAKNVDTRLMLSSFSRGSGYGIYDLDIGALTLTVGTKVEYAKWVNDGHRQTPGRFVPGYFKGGKFTYQKGAKTGMILKQNRVEGSKFFDKSIMAFRNALPELSKRAEKEFETFIQRYF